MSMRPVSNAERVFPVLELVSAMLPKVRNPATSSRELVPVTLMVLFAPLVPTKASPAITICAPDSMLNAFLSLFRPTSRPLAEAWAASERVRLFSLLPSPRIIKSTTSRLVLVPETETSFLSEVSRRPMRRLPSIEAFPPSARVSLFCRPARPTNRSLPTASVELVPETLISLPLEVSPI